MYLLRSSGKAKILQTVEKFPILCGNIKFIIVFTTAGPALTSWSVLVESSWNVMAHGDALEGKWRGNWQMKWVSSTLHTTSEHGVSSITIADAHTSDASSRLKWMPCRFKWTRPFHRKTKSVFRACAITFQKQSTSLYWYQHSGRKRYFTRNNLVHRILDTCYRVASNSTNFLSIKTVW